MYTLSQPVVPQKIHQLEHWPSPVWLINDFDTWLTRTQSELNFTYICELSDYQLTHKIEPTMISSLNRYTPLYTGKGWGDYSFNRYTFPGRKMKENI